MTRAPHYFFATAPKGVPPLLAEELRALGIRDVSATSAGVTFSGPLEVAYRACLWSRLANRVLLPVLKTTATTPEQLYDAVRAFAWEEHLDARGTLAVDCTLTNAAFTHSHYVALKVKDAIVDRMRDLFGERPSVDVERPDLRVNVHIRQDRARVSVDLSGSSLHRRGYRGDGGQAPLKENLAAAVLHFAGWPEVARTGGPLLDPMCGSGTLLIEGAWLALDRAPGLDRDHFGFLNWKQHDAALWESLLSEARARRDAGRQRNISIRGYDADADAVHAALENVATAGLRGVVHIERRELGGGKAESASPQPGLIVTNPPYGARLGETQALRTTYAELGRFIGNFPGWRAAVFTGNPELAAYLGLRSTHMQDLYNGPIECKLFHYRVAEAASDAAHAAAPISAGAEMFANRLRKNLKQMAKWAEREGVDCYRVYDADLPEYALAIDLYHGVQRLVHVQEYAAPAGIDPEKAQQRLQEALAVLPSVLDVAAEQVFFKVRRRQKGREQYEKGAEAGHFYQVREGGLKFWVNFSGYLDTGLFLDHRITRGVVREWARGKKFLNLFAYTGTGTVYAAAGGACSTTTVDMSRTYLEWAQRNLELNGFGGRQHELIQADCVQWLEQQQHERVRYGLIFLDPPTFSNSKRMEDVFDVQRDHAALIRLCMNLLEQDGVLLFSNNFRKFKLDEEVTRTWHVEDLTRRTLPKDFERNPRIHQCWKITRGS